MDAISMNARILNNLCDGVVSDGLFVLFNDEVAHPLFYLEVRSVVLCPTELTSQVLRKQEDLNRMSSERRVKLV